MRDQQPTRSQPPERDTLGKGHADVESSLLSKACPSEPMVGQNFRPRWLGIFLGRIILRVCPDNRPSEPCEGCHLRALCKCAQDHHFEAAAIEMKVWTMLLAASLGALLLWLFWSFSN